MQLIAETNASEKNMGIESPAEPEEMNDSGSEKIVSVQQSEFEGKKEFKWSKEGLVEGKENEKHVNGMFAEKARDFKTELGVKLIKSPLLQKAILTVGAIAIKTIIGSTPDFELLAGIDLISDPDSIIDALNEGVDGVQDFDPDKLVYDKRWDDPGPHRDVWGSDNGVGEASMEKEGVTNSEGGEAIIPNTPLVPDRVSAVEFAKPGIPEGFEPMKTINETPRPVTFQDLGRNSGEDEIIRQFQKSDGGMGIEGADGKGIDAGGDVKGTVPETVATGSGKIPETVATGSGKIPETVEMGGVVKGKIPETVEMGGVVKGKIPETVETGNNHAVENLGGDNENRGDRAPIKVGRDSYGAEDAKNLSGVGGDSHKDVVKLGRIKSLLEKLKS